MREQEFFDVLSDEIRRRMLALLYTERELCVCELFHALELPQPKVSRHLAVLREAGVVSVRRAGTWMYYRLAPALPLWAYRIVEQMVTGLAEEAVYRGDRERWRALPRPLTA